jgi:hypothetical protein
MIAGARRQSARELTGGAEMGGRRSPKKARAALDRKTHSGVSGATRFSYKNCVETFPEGGK